MAVQNAANLSTVPFVRSGTSYVKEGLTLLTDGARSTPLATYTLLAKVAASGKLVPFTNEAATDGSARPYGIYLGDAVAATDIAAGDVTDFGPVLVGGACTVDENQLVIENSKTLATVIGTGVTLTTVGDVLEDRGIFVEATVNFDEFENA